jgi:hypothetical protein
LLRRRTGGACRRILAGRYEHAAAARPADLAGEPVSDASGGLSRLQPPREYDELVTAQPRKVSPRRKAARHREATLHRTASLRA